MSLIDIIDDPQIWREFYHFKLEKQHLSKKEEQKLLAFIENREYTAAVDRIREGRGFSYPKKCLISKHASQKKRTVFIYPQDENYVLKLLAWLLRKYDSLFDRGLYSFRASKMVADAIRTLTARHRTDRMYSYKVDISDYFNSIDVSLLMPMLQEALQDDEQLFRFLKAQLENPYCMEAGKVVSAKKGAMAGVPFSGFCANLYLRKLDRAFAGRLYARYSDDIIVFADTAQQRDRDEEQIKRILAEMKLIVNPEKEYRTAPGEQWTYLGIAYRGGVVDISPVSVEKLKEKMRRKARALIRWRVKKGLEPRFAARAMIRRFNRKFFEADDDDETTWCRWYFPLINTDASLKVIDACLQEHIRYIMTEKHTKAAYNCRYEQMKQMGYRTLVNAYYAQRTETEERKE